MNDVKIFQNKEFGDVRVVEHEGQPWFVASDVAKALGYERPNDAVNAHCKKLNKFSYGNSPQGAMPYNIIPESDVYRLVMRSNLPSAERFQDWVCEEILPSIRKTGHYGAPQTEDEILSQALIIAEGRLGMLSHAVSDLQEQIALDAPKVELAEAIMETEECVSINQFAKVLKQRGLDIGANRLYRDLRRDGYLMRRKGTNWNMPTQRMMDKGYFRVVERMTEADDGYQFVTVTTMITGAGQYHLFAHFLDKYGVRRQLSFFDGHRILNRCPVMMTA